MGIRQLVLLFNILFVLKDGDKGAFVTDVQLAEIAETVDNLYVDTSAVMVAIALAQSAQRRLFPKGGPPTEATENSFLTCIERALWHRLNELCETFHRAQIVLVLDGERWRFKSPRLTANKDMLQATQAKVNAAFAKQGALETQLKKLTARTALGDKDKMKQRITLEVGQVVVVVVVVGVWRSTGG
jgi:transposase